MRFNNQVFCEEKVRELGLVSLKETGSRPVPKAALQERYRETFLQGQLVEGQGEWF